MAFLGEFIGVLAGICTAITFLPQSIKTIKTHDTGGLSMGSYVIYCTGLMLWIAYGIYLHSIQMIFFNAVSLIFSSIILYIIVRQK